jgi:hypothetical protein
MPRALHPQQQLSFTAPTAPKPLLLLQGLRAAEKVFGADVNSKGFKMIRGAGVIQGDGIDIVTLQVNYLV